MKNGYKKLTSHGSISIPVAMRRDIGLQGGDPMEVSQSGGNIIIRPYTPRCVFCGTSEGVHKFEGKGICSECAEKALAIMEGGSH
jgi:transcriptional pleiotropic regulator of transition state genes